LQLEKLVGSLDDALRSDNGAQGQIQLSVQAALLLLVPSVLWEAVKDGINGLGVSGRQVAVIAQYGGADRHRHWGPGLDVGRSASARSPIESRKGLAAPSASVIVAKTQARLSTLVPSEESLPVRAANSAGPSSWMAPGGSRL